MNFNRAAPHLKAGIASVLHEHLFEDNFWKQDLILSTQPCRTLFPLHHAPAATCSLTLGAPAAPCSLTHRAPAAPWSLTLCSRRTVLPLHPSPTAPCSPPQAPDGHGAPLAGG